MMAVCAIVMPSLDGILKKNVLSCELSEALRK